MATTLAFANNTISTFQYEEFWYVIYNSKTPLTVPPAPGIPIGYLTVDASAVIFKATSNIMSAGTQFFTIIDASSNVSSNTVTIGAGRFRDASSNSLSGNAYTFYKGEPIPQIPLYAPFAVSLPTASPILPPGLAFYNVSNGTLYNISGIPTVTSPQSNHLFLGKGTGSNLGKIITSSNVAMVVSNERMLIDVSGPTIISNMRIDTQIATRAITARFPPYPSGGTLTYSWSGLPNGIVVKDLSGNIRNSGFEPIDPSYTLVLEGAPTLSAAQAFQQAGITSNVVNIVATRTDPAPALTSNIPFTFAFGPTALFTDNVVRNPLFVNVPLDPLSNYFRAQVYFGAGNITDIDAPYGLPPGLSLSSLVAGRRNLIGTPTTDASSGLYTIRAFSDISPPAVRTVLANINILNDVVTFSSPNDVCYSFIEARPLSNALAGYYPYPIDFKASALSGFPLTFTGSNIPSGIDFSYPSSGTARLVGSTLTPSTLNKLRVTASVAISGVSAYRDVCYEVLTDAITFADVSALMFVQNRQITPTQFFATSRSGRTVTSYTSPNLPAGLVLTRTGRLSGTPTGTIGTSFTVSASTGFGSPQSNSFNYNITADSILLLAVPPVSTYVPGANVSIDINGFAYSGGVVGHYSLKDISESAYGISINSNTGLISGILTPPLPSFKKFYVDASLGEVDASTSCTMTAILSGVPRTFLFDHAFGDISQSALYFSDTSSLTSWNFSNDFPPGSWITDFQAKNTTLDSNTFLACYSGFGSNSIVKRSTDGLTFRDTSFIDMGPNARAYTAINPSNTSTWYIGGSGLAGSSNRVIFYTSTNDGQTWVGASGETTGLLMEPRKSTDISSYYTYKGVALGHSNGMYMIGGEKMMRSDDASRWTDVTGGFTTEVGAFSMTGPVWVATGSSGNSSGSNYGSFTRTSTLKWSDDQGANWTDATGDAGDFIGYEVAYTSNTWLSTAMARNGSDTSIVSKFLCSSDGKDWSNITLDVPFTVFTQNHLPEVGSLWFDGSNWNAIVKLDSSLAMLYSHDLATPLTTGWTSTGPLTPFGSNAQLRGFLQRSLRTGVPANLTFTFATPPTGPRVLSPTERSFIAYQYVPITPITFDVSGTGFLYYFVDAATLPVGITFDPLTATLTGTSVQLGTRRFDIYIRDSVGVTPVSAQITTVIPTVTRQQTGAGAWTSLVRQYTEVNAAQNSVNGKVLPSTEATLGEFMRPEPPDSVSAVSCDKPL